MIGQSTDCGHAAFDAGVCWNDAIGLGIVIARLLCSALVLLLAGMVGCEDPNASSRAEVEPTDEAARLPNVVIVLVDTLRADHTSLEGYARDTTPGLRSIAAEGLTFRQHFVNAPWTKSSVASILTGLLPPAHGSQWGDVFSEEASVDLLPDVFDTLPELLRDGGYATHAYVTNPTVSPDLGYDQGFDRFEMLPGTLDDDRRVAELTKRALDSSVRPAFVWCHLMAPHNYNVPPEAEIFPHSWKTPIREEERAGDVIIRRYGMRSREQAIAIYDSTIVYADEIVADLVDHIRREHPNTLVVITSDHGEEFGEHGGYLHARTLYNEVLRVPLVLWGPEIPRGQSVDSMTSSIDLLPTILAYVGLPVPDGPGGSLLGPPAETEAPVYAERRNGFTASRAWITRDGKLIETKPPIDRNIKPPMEGEGTFEFFEDPLGAEQDDSIGAVSEERFDRALSRMEEVWSKASEFHAVRTKGVSLRGRLTDEERAQLQALGYGD